MPRTKKSQTSSSKPLIIGITGGIASGKSTVTTHLRSKGFTVICADEIVHSMTAKGSRILTIIRKQFGSEFFDDAGELNRSHLAKAVFANRRLRIRLERILHPRVHKRLRQLITEAKQHRRQTITQSPQMIFIDVPLLFESGLQTMCDVVICVFATKKLRLHRLIKLRRMKRSEALMRIQAQMPLQAKASRSDIVIRNNSDLGTLRRLVDRALVQLSTVKSCPK